jgi:hypothetical protein
LDERVPPDRYPWWVKFSRLGSRSRSSQKFWVAASVGAALLCFWLALDETGLFRAMLALAGVWGFIAAGLYYGTIRWIDRHGSWDELR